MDDMMNKDVAENPFFEDEDEHDLEEQQLRKGPFSGGARPKGGLPAVPVRRLSSGDLPSLRRVEDETPELRLDRGKNAHGDAVAGSKGAGVGKKGLPKVDSGVPRTARDLRKGVGGRGSSSSKLPPIVDDSPDDVAMLTGLLDSAAPARPDEAGVRGLDALMNTPVSDSAGSVDDEVSLSVDDLLGSYEGTEEVPEGDDAFADDASVDDMSAGDDLSSFLEDSDFDELDVDEDLDDDDEPKNFYTMIYGGDQSDEEGDFFQGFDLDAILSDAIDMKASDVHVTADRHVRFTILGDITRMEKYPVPTGNVAMRLQQSIVSSQAGQNFTENLELDTSYVLRKGRYKGQRTRLNVGKIYGEIGFTFRIISDVIPTPESLGVPPEMIAWSDLPSGLFLLNGSTGSGKSTSIASLLRRIQLTQPKKIVTIEKPIEYTYDDDGRALMWQREVGRDCRSFSDGLTSAMRQAPDIILIGEVRDRAEVSQLLRAAETGHLAISTIHADSVAMCINRIISNYEGDEQARILNLLADMTRGMANQVLLRSADGKSRFALHEVLTFTPEISEMVAAGNISGVRKYQLDHGITMEHSLVRAVKEGRCTREAAFEKSPFPALFNELMGD